MSSPQASAKQSSPGKNQKSNGIPQKPPTLNSNMFKKIKIESCRNSEGSVSNKAQKDFQLGHFRAIAGRNDKSFNLEDEDLPSFLQNKIKAQDSQETMADNPSSSFRSSLQSDTSGELKFIKKSSLKSRENVKLESESLQKSQNEIQKQQIDDKSLKQDSNSTTTDTTQLQQKFPPQNWKCKVHLNQAIKTVCLDQFCDYQRLLCESCEQTEHFLRHQQKCIMLHELINQNEKDFSLKNWPQDQYLRIFQNYLKGQNNQYEAQIVDECNKLLAFVKEKIEALVSILLQICKNEKDRNKSKNQKLAQVYIEQCCNLDKLRQQIFKLGEDQQEFINGSYDKQNIAKQEREIGKFISEEITKHSQFKGDLNLKFGFGYFSNHKEVSPPVNVDLINSEFESIKKSIDQMAIFLQKNISLTNQKAVSNSENEVQWDNTETAISYNTSDHNQEKIIFKPEEKTVLIKRSMKPAFFFSSVLPQQSILQIRIVGPIKCGTYLGLISDHQRNIAILPQSQQSHFVGTCLACSHENYGQCRVEGSGVYLRRDELGEGEGSSEKENNMKKDLMELINNNRQLNPMISRSSSLKNQSQSQQYFNQSDQDEREFQCYTQAYNIMTNLTKKMFSISDLSGQQYLKFDLEDKNYFFNNNVRLFIQSPTELQFQMIKFSFP